MLSKLPKQQLLCKGNCRSNAFFGSVGQLAKAFGVNGQLDGQADGMPYVHRVASPFHGLIRFPDLAEPFILPLLPKLTINEH